MEKRAGNGKQEKVYRIFEEIAGSYDSANERISLGMQRLWKKMLADRLFKDVGSMSEKAPRILDLCTGTGDIAILAARRNPGWKVVGLDFSPAMLKLAAEKGAKYRCRNVRWREGNAMEIPYPDGTFEGDRQGIETGGGAFVHGLLRAVKQSRKALLQNIFPVSDADHRRRRNTQERVHLAAGVH